MRTFFSGLIDLIFRVMPFDTFASVLRRLLVVAKVRRLSRKHGVTIHFIGQGEGGLEIDGPPGSFSIHESSHLKSNTYIDCTGKVSIGRYFHTGRGLTIFSANHDYRSADRIPYDEKVLALGVTIEDFVWCGANVTIMPGVTIREGAIVGGGAVVAKDVACCTIVAGNPAKVIGERDKARFLDLKTQGKFS